MIDSNPKTRRVGSIILAMFSEMQLSPADALIICLNLVCIVAATCVRDDSDKDSLQASIVSGLAGMLEKAMEDKDA